MKYVLLAAGAAALGLSAPVAARPGNGHGNPHAYGYGNAYGVHGPLGYGAGGCPPGLARKAVPCMPPGQARKMYNVGQRLPRGAMTSYGYNRIPYDLRSQYRLSPNNRYYYGNGYLYGVNPRTMVVQQVIGALLGR